MTRRRIDLCISALIRALQAPRYLDLSLPTSSFPPSAAGTLVQSPPGSVCSPCRSVKTFTAEVTFTCICGEHVRGLLVMRKDGSATIRCQECGSLHHSAKAVVANTGTDCKHPVTVYDPRCHEYTCVECFAHWHGELRRAEEGEQR